jgi:hypothetical protein
MFRLDVYHHIDPLDSERANRKLEDIFAQLKQLGVKIMSVSDQIKKLAADFDAETNAVAARIDAILAKLAEGTVDPADVAALEAVSARLKTLGEDPSNPIPPPVV